MTLPCGVEEDLLDAVAAGRWPDRAGADLRTHVEACDICRDVAAIAGAFLDARDAALAEAVVPPAAVVWWRAQMRTREEAARAAAKPIVVVQAAATICVFGASVALAPSASEWVRRFVAGLSGAEWWFSSRDLTFSWVLSTAAYTTVPLIAVGLWLVLAPVLVYLALDD